MKNEVLLWAKHSLNVVTRCVESLNQCLLHETNWRIHWIYNSSISK